MNVEEKTLPERLKQTYSRSQLAPSKSVREKSNSLVCKKKRKRTVVADRIVNELRKKLNKGQ